MFLNQFVPIEPKGQLEFVKYILTKLAFYFLIMSRQKRSSTKNGNTIGGQSTHHYQTKCIVSIMYSTEYSSRMDKVECMQLEYLRPYITR